MQEEMLSTREVAKWLGMAPESLRRWRTHGHELRWIKLGKLIRYRRADVQAFIDKHERATTRERA